MTFGIRLIDKEVAHTGIYILREIHTLLPRKCILGEMLEITLIYNMEAAAFEEWR